MRNGSRQDARKTAMTAVSVLMLGVVLFSACFIIIEADHDCSGEQCPVCAAIRLCECTLRLIVGGTVTRILAPAAVCIAFVPAVSVFTAPETPVSRMVRMNN